jgi:uncharacterized membrane protein
MAEPIPDAVKSTAAIAGHPIHPMLVPLPIGALVGVFVSDMAYMGTTSSFWAEASRWLLLAGIVTGALAGIFGLIDFITLSYVRSRMAAWVHFVGNGVAIALSLINLFSRPSDPTSGVATGSLVLSLIVVVILLVTGWLGGELSYRYRVGVMPRTGESI